MQDAAWVFAKADTDDVAARRRLLAPLLQEAAPSEELLELGELVREHFHMAYGDATELSAA
eukprot:2433705-Prymnesium_polylepis.1